MPVTSLNASPNRFLASEAPAQDDATTRPPAGPFATPAEVVDLPPGVRQLFERTRSPRLIPEQRVERDAAAAAADAIAERVGQARAAIDDQPALAVAAQQMAPGRSSALLAA